LFFDLVSPGVRVLAVTDLVLEVREVPVQPCLRADYPAPAAPAGEQALDTAITLPVGVEAYGAYALGAWLTPGVGPAARRFARRSALGSLALGMAGQVIYHLLAAAHAHRAPWPVVVLVSCLPVITLGFGAGLTHLLRAGHTDADPEPASDIAADTSPASTPDAEVDNAPDTTPVIRPARTRTPRRAPARTGTAAAVARLRARHPDMPATDIARRIGVSDRTVRRHLAARPTPTEPSSVAA
jgi:DNA-binding transcriptional ArsR family regulator